VTLRLGDLRTEWQAFCRKHHISESEGVRLAIAATLRKGSPILLRSTDDEKSDPTYIKFRLGKKAQQAAKVHAQYAGIKTVNRWVKHLVVSAVSKEPQLVANELDALIDSTVQLMAIGRNLNQLVRDKNAGQKIADYRLAVVDALQKSIQSHLKQVNGVLVANLERRGKA